MSVSHIILIMLIPLLVAGGLAILFWALARNHEASELERQNILLRFEVVVLKKKLRRQQTNGTNKASGTDHGTHDGWTHIKRTIDRKAQDGRTSTGACSGKTD